MKLIFSFIHPQLPNMDTQEYTHKKATTKTKQLELETKLTLLNSNSKFVGKNLKFRQTPTWTLPTETIGGPRNPDRKSVGRSLVVVGLLPPELPILYASLKPAPHAATFIHDVIWWLASGANLWAGFDGHDSNNARFRPLLTVGYDGASAPSNHCTLEKSRFFNSHIFLYFVDRLFSYFRFRKNIIFSS